MLVVFMRNCGGFMSLLVVVMFTCTVKRSASRSSLKCWAEC